MAQMKTRQKQREIESTRLKLAQLESEQTWESEYGELPWDDEAEWNGYEDEYANEGTAVTQPEPDDVPTPTASTPEGGGPQASAATPPTTSQQLLSQAQAQPILDDDDSLRDTAIKGKKRGSKRQRTTSEIAEAVTDPSAPDLQIGVPTSISASSGEPSAPAKSTDVPARRRAAAPGRSKVVKPPGMGGP